MYIGCQTVIRMGGNNCDFKWSDKESLTWNISFEQRLQRDGE